MAVIAMPWVEAQELLIHQGRAYGDVIQLGFGTLDHASLQQEPDATVPCDLVKQATECYNA